MKYIAYKPSNNSNPINIGITVLISVIIAFFLGWLYSLMTVMPIIYVKIFITVAFGYALAFAVQIASKFLNIKSSKTRLLITGVVLLFAYYSHWISFIIQTYEAGFPTFLSYAAYWINPVNIFAAITEVNKYGTWGLGSSNVPVNGLFLSLIWLAEAVLIFAIALVHMYKLPENPFSERLNQWYPKMVLSENFEPLYSPSRFAINFKNEGIDLILNLPSGFPSKYSKISIFYLEGESVQYLSIDSVFISVKENAKKKITPLIKPVEIATADAKKLFEKFDTEKESSFNLIHFFK